MLMQQVLDRYSAQVVGSAATWSADELRQAVGQVVSFIESHFNGGQANAGVALMADNSPAWMAIDLASHVLIERGVRCPLLPLPSFFTADQLQHAVRQSNPRWLITDDATRVNATWGERMQACGSLLGFQVFECRVQAAEVQALPLHTQKITYTSGSTGSPKPVYLGAQQQWSVAQALQQVTAGIQVHKHLQLLPLSVLLENVGGVYVPLLANADIVSVSLNEVGLLGSTQFDAPTALKAMVNHQAESVILLPQTLHALLAASMTQSIPLTTLRFAAVGGGKVPARLLMLADHLGWPVYEGYGLSECASVVCLNTPENKKPGTVGKPLPGVSVRVDEHGEIWVQGRGAEDSHEWIATGDLGSLDAQGYLSIQGRKKNVLITGFGRNVSPEWPESLFLDTGLFRQVLVYGEGQTRLQVALVPLQAMTDAQAKDVVQRVNQQLPDYAQLHTYRMEAPWTFESGFLTSNGRLKRAALIAHFEQTPDCNIEIIDQPVTPGV